MMNGVSQWTIFIDDVEGELAMDKREGYGGREIEVLAKEEVEVTVKDFFEFIKHGDEEHKAWLKQKFEFWFDLKIEGNS